jgi:hypothetical protein
MEEKSVPMAHLFVCPVLLSFTGMNLIMPYKISATTKLKTPTIVTSKGRMVETPRRIKNESKKKTRDTARQAQIVCTPIGIFANARFIACNITVASVLSNIKKNYMKFRLR